MPDEMLSFFAGGSTPGFAKPVAYGTIEVPVIEDNKVRKIAHDAPQHFSHLRVWCKDHLWAPGCCHGSVGHGWEVVGIMCRRREALYTGSVLKCGVIVTSPKRRRNNK